jgi:hypothetical protein
VAAALNARPRKALGWKTPAEALDEWLPQVNKSVLRRPFESALQALIRMVDHAARPPLTERHVESVEHHLRRLCAMTQSGHKIALAMPR